MKKQETLKQKQLSLKEYFTGEDYSKKRWAFSLTAISVYYLMLLCYEVIYAYWVIESFVMHGNSTKFYMALVGLVLVQIIEVVAYHLWFVGLHKIEYGNEYKRSRQTFSNFLHAKTEKCIQIPEGNIINTIAYNTCNGSFVFYHLSVTIGNLISALIYAAIMLFISWQITLIMFCAYLVSMLLYNLVTRINYKANFKATTYYNEYFQVVSESIEGLPSIKVDNKEKDISRLFQNSNKTLCNYQFSNSFADKFSGLINLIIGNILMVSVYLLGGFQVTKGIFTIAHLFLFIDFLSLFVVRVSDANTQLVTVRNKLANASKYKEFNQIEQEDIMKNYTGEIINIKKCIEFKDITHTYNRKKFLENFNLKMHAGETLFAARDDVPAITNICNILTGFYTRESGEVLFDNEPIENKSLYDIRNSIAYCLKDSEILSGTILGNITMFNKEKEAEERAKKIAKEIGLEKNILAFEDGYMTFVKTTQSNLSEAERQLICIARALAQEKDILLINNSLNILSDVQAERVLDYIRKNRKGKINFIATNKHHLILDKERVIYISGGTVKHDAAAEKLRKKKII